MPTSYVSQNIRLKLTEHDQSQTVLEGLLGLTRSAVSRRVCGEVPFRDQELVKIAKHFDVEVSTLFTPSTGVVGK